MGFIFSKFSKLGSGAKPPPKTPPPQCLKQTNFSNPPTPFGLATPLGLPGLPGYIRVDSRHNCHGWLLAGEKSLQFINTPSHSQMMAKPRLNVSFLSYSYPHCLFHPMPCTSSSLSYPTCTIIHRFLISTSVPASSGTCFSLSFLI